MKDYLNEINDLIPIRRKKEEKAKLFEYVKGELGEGRVKKETLEGKHENIIIGDIESAKIIFTAHYDTPATSLIPNMMFPANKLFGMLIHMIYPLVLAALSLALGYLIGGLLSFGDAEVMLLYLVLYFGAFFGTTMLKTNRHNKNDNTSGVATVMSIASETRDECVAFVLFDNEEKGLLGSKAFNKKHKQLLSKKLVVNFDCVGNGDQMIFIPKSGAEGLPEYDALRSVANSDDNIEVHYIPFKKSLGNSDHKSFPCGVGVVAARRGKMVKFFTGRIHTERDTVADSKNVYFLKERMLQLINRI